MIISEDHSADKTKRKGSPSGTLLKITIDGPAGAGKSTVAKRVAEKLDYLYIDTGAMYRALTWLVIQNHLEITNEKAIVDLAHKATLLLKPGDKSSHQQSQVFINGQNITKEIRTRQITNLVSEVSKIAALRECLVKQQRSMAKNGGVVLDGRDTGTVVLPDANVKIFLTASPEVRAKRRLAELKLLGEDWDYQTLLKEIIERDKIDSNRAIAPLRMADDAVLILTDHMRIDDVVSHIINLCT